MDTLSKILNNYKTENIFLFDQFLLQKLLTFKEEKFFGGKIRSKTRITVMLGAKMTRDQKMKSLRKVVNV